MPEIRIQYNDDKRSHVITTALTGLIINGVLVYFFYIYYNKNPDLAKHGDCWADSSDSDKEVGSPVESTTFGFDTNVSN